VATVFYIPSGKSKGLLEAIKSNSKTIKHDLSQSTFAIEKGPNLVFFIDDSLDYIEKLTALASKDNPIENRDLLEKRKLI
jgi:ribosome-binding factor A